jgi:DNA-directed RNA polymerase alpha subunit
MNPYEHSPEHQFWLDVGLSTRPANALAFEGITNIEMLKTLDEQHLLRIPNFGPKSLREIQKLTGYPVRRKIRLLEKYEDLDLIRILEDRGYVVTKTGEQ